MGAHSKESLQKYPFTTKKKTSAKPKVRAIAFFLRVLFIFAPLLLTLFF